MKNTALVLEGGGMRGIFTSGVLDAFIEKGIDIPYVIGVSMGAYNGVSYITGQKERTFKMFMDYIYDPRLLDYKRIFKGDSLLNSDFLINFMGKNKYPVDYDKFFESTKKFICVSTNCRTGKPAYFEKNGYPQKYFNRILKSSCSYPFLTDTVKIGGEEYLDGGIADAIPIKKALDDGNKKLIVILCHPKGYEDEPSWYLNISKLWYHSYPKVAESLKKRYIAYNGTLYFLDLLEKENIAYVIRPESMPLSVIEQDKVKLRLFYKSGYNKGIEECEKLEEFLKTPSLI
ncbi:patatin family protein [uncultured Ilyobacter sp.]|uniref:patatin-like phospholipase family protein n=1 Tax=uncultured Ilyobacter sp. TaxID=544433 RepID=UPI002AA8F510|nr:patatin family protein [uncultured Ilyobacter sp.]